MATFTKKVSQKSGGLSADTICKKVEHKAYELWQKRGCAHGNDWADWFEAERKVKLSPNA